MSYGDNGAGVALQVLLKPGNGFSVEMVGRLVKEQNVRFLQQQSAQGHPALFTTGQDIDYCIAGGAAQGVHGLLEAAVEVPGVEMIELLLNLGLTGD